MTRTRVVVLGADAAGMSAAHQALRSAKQAGADLEVLALEKTQHTSYSACGLPYWVAGDVASASELVARDPERHRAMGVDLITGATATSIDTAGRSVTYLHDGDEKKVDYDQLVIATGASPDVPAWARLESGEMVGGVAPCKTLTDGELWIQRLTGPLRTRTARPTVVVAGGGYIGVEMAEAARRRGFEVTLITRSSVMSSLDLDMGSRIEKALTEAGVAVVCNAEVDGLEVDGTGWVRWVTTVDGNKHPCDLLVLSTGVRPVTDFGAVGLPTGESGGFLAEPDGALAEGVWAAGDCCEARHRLTGQWAYVPLGTHANKQGRTVGFNLVSPGTKSFGGVLGTAVTRFVHADVHVEIARTGLSTREATAAGLDVASLVTEGRTASGYMPESSPIAVKLLASRTTRQLVGGQIVGGGAAGKRIDTIAAVLWSHGSVDDLADMDLAYAPPFATVWEAVQLAARRLADSL